jgi:hypothetical protein
MVEVKDFRIVEQCLKSHFRWVCGEEWEWGFNKNNKKILKMIILIK